MALATEGSGPNGHSFEASLNDWPAALVTRWPGLYGANWSSTERNRGDRSDTVVLRRGGLAASLAVCHPRSVRRPPARLGSDRARIRWRHGCACLATGGVGGDQRDGGRQDDQFGQ